MTDENSVTLSEQAIALRDLKEERDEAKAEYERLANDYKAAMYALLDRMEEEQCEGHKAGGINFVPASTTYAQVQDKDTFITWAKENEPELIELDTRDGLLNQLVRTLLDNGEPFPPGLGFYERRIVSQRAA